MPMKSEKLTGRFVERLLNEGLAAEMDKLSLWNIKRARIQRLNIRSLLRKIGFRADEKEMLSENMVFWAVLPSGKRTPESLFHATRAARLLSKKIYSKVNMREGDKS